MLKFTIIVVIKKGNKMLEMQSQNQPEQPLPAHYSQEAEEKHQRMVYREQDEKLEKEKEKNTPKPLVTETRDKPQNRPPNNNSLENLDPDKNKAVPPNPKKEPADTMNSKLESPVANNLELPTINKPTPESIPKNSQDSNPNQPEIDKKMPDNSDKFERNSNNLPPNITNHKLT